MLTGANGKGREGAKNKTGGLSLTHNRARYRSLMPPHQIALQELYAHHDPDIVIDAVPAVIAWIIKGARSRKPPFVFEVDHEPRAGAAPVVEIIELTWDLALLRQQDLAVADRARRLEQGRTVQREHLTELAGYGLAMVAITVLMPGRRVVDVRRGLPPDLLFDSTPGALRGVEVAARLQGGRGTLAAVRGGKEPALVARTDVVEAHLSLWCSRPRVGIHAMLKP